MWRCLRWREEPQSTTLEHHGNAAPGWTSGPHKDKWHISSEWPRSEVQTLCLKPAPMRLLNKGPICSIIIYWHKECSQGGNIVQNRNSELGSSGHRGFLLWTAISSSISENKRTQVFLPKSKVRKILTLSLEATSFMELPHHVSFTDPVKYTECDIGTQELNSLAGLFLRGKSWDGGRIHKTVNVLLQKPSSIITANITLAWYRKQGVFVGVNRAVPELGMECWKSC